MSTMTIERRYPLEHVPVTDLLESPVLRRAEMATFLELSRVLCSPSIVQDDRFTNQGMTLVEQVGREDWIPHLMNHTEIPAVTVSTTRCQHLFRAPIGVSQLTFSFEKTRWAVVLGLRAEPRPGLFEPALVQFTNIFRMIEGGLGKARVEYLLSQLMSSVDEEVDLDAIELGSTDAGSLDVPEIGCGASEFNSATPTPYPPPHGSLDHRRHERDMAGFHRDMSALYSAVQARLMANIIRHSGWVVCGPLSIGSTYLLEPYVPGDIGYARIMSPPGPPPGMKDRPQHRLPPSKASRLSNRLLEGTAKGPTRSQDVGPRDDNRDGGHDTTPKPANSTTAQNPPTAPDPPKNDFGIPEAVAAALATQPDEITIIVQPFPSQTNSPSLTHGAGPVPVAVRNPQRFHPKGVRHVPSRHASGRHPPENLYNQARPSQCPAGPPSGCVPQSGPHPPTRPHAPADHVNHSNHHHHHRHPQGPPPQSNERPQSTTPTPTQDIGRRSWPAQPHQTQKWDEPETGKTPVLAPLQISAVMSIPDTASPPRTGDTSSSNRGARAQGAMDHDGGMINGFGNGDGSHMV